MSEKTKINMNELGQQINDDLDALEDDLASIRAKVKKLVEEFDARQAHINRILERINAPTNS